MSVYSSNLLVAATLSCSMVTPGEHDCVAGSCNAQYYKLCNCALALTHGCTYTCTYINRHGYKSIILFLSMVGMKIACVHNIF